MTTRIALLLTAFLFLFGARAACLAAVAAQSQEAPLVLVENGRAKATVVIGPAAAPPERFAAEELVKYIEMISGAKVGYEKIAGDEQSEAAKALLDNLAQQGRAAIVLGTPKSNVLLAPLQGRLQALPPDGFIIKTDSRNLLLAGNNPRGSLYAVYTLLEDYLGVSWAQFPTANGNLSLVDETVPASPTIRIARIDKTWQPALDYRAEQFSYDRLSIADIDWLAKNKMNHILFHLFPVKRTYDRDAAYDRVVSPEIEKRGLNVELSHHIFKRWLRPSDELFAEHPEYFALVDGERKQDIPQFSFCLSHPKVAELMADNIKTFLRHHPEVDVIDLWPEDGHGVCQCEKCRAAGATGGLRDKKTDYAMQFTNRVARRVAAEFPNVVLSYLAYVNITAPPDRVKPDEHVMIYFANYWRCFSHTIDDPNCETNRKFYDYLKGWCKLSPKVAIHEYYYGMDAYAGLPYPVVNVMARDLRTYKDMGILGLTCVTKPGRSSPIYRFNAYAFSKLVWQPQLTADAIIDDYCNRYFPTAAEPMKRFYKRWEKAVSDLEASGEDYKPYPWWIGKLVDEKMLTELAALLDEADRASRTDVVDSRLKFVRKHWLDYPRLAAAIYAKVDSALAHKKQGRLDLMAKDKDELLPMLRDMALLEVDPRFVQDILSRSLPQMTGE